MIFIYGTKYLAEHQKVGKWLEEQENVQVSGYKRI